MCEASIAWLLTWKITKFLWRQIERSSVDPAECGFPAVDEKSRIF